MLYLRALPVLRARVSMLPLVVSIYEGVGCKVLWQFAGWTARRTS